MTFEQITSLLDRGFTPDQITLLSTSDGPTPSDTADTGAGADPLTPAPESADNTPAADPEDNTPAADPPAPAVNNSEVLDAIADLKKSIQANNIRTMSVDSVDADNALEKAMSEIIRPSLEKGE